MYVISRLNSILCGPALFIAVFGAGVFFLFKLKFFFVLHPVRTARAMFPEKGKGDGPSPFAAMCTALAGTLGVGNVVGVAGAVALGGPGAVFWMWVSALAAMVLKYAEVTLGVRWRVKKKDGLHGGAPYYIRDAAGMPRTAKLFALLCVAASFTLGNAVQVRAAAEASGLSLGVHPALTGGAIAAVCFAVGFCGLKGVSAFTVRLIPALTVVFVAMSCASIFARAGRIPDVFGEIFRSAFTPSAAAGGAAGAVFSRAARYGLARGLASNEAGCGTAPTAHAAARTDLPARQGLWGIAEVAVDTVFLCTLTALVILVNRTEGAGEGIAPALGAFSSVFGKAAGYVVCFCVFFFALSTVICWSYYGAEAVGFLSPRPVWKKLYLAVFFLSTVPFSVTRTSLLWEASDLVCAVMTCINVAVLVTQSGEIKRMTEKIFLQSR